MNRLNEYPTYFLPILYHLCTCHFSTSGFELGRAMDKSFPKKSKSNLSEVTNDQNYNTGLCIVCKHIVMVRDDDGGSCWYQDQDHYPAAVCSWQSPCAGRPGVRSGHVVKVGAGRLAAAANHQLSCKANLRGPTCTSTWAWVSCCWWARLCHKESLANKHLLKYINGCQVFSLCQSVSIRAAHRARPIKVNFSMKNLIH